MIIYSPKITNRLQFTVHFIFKQVLNIEFILTNNIEEYNIDSTQKVNYSADRSLTGIYIKPAYLLFEETIQPGIPNHFGFSRNLTLFPNDSDIGFDIFSAVFYMISRYEEYLPFQPDVHKRFPASESLNSKLGILDIPIVNIWIQKLKSFIKERYPGFDTPSKFFNSILTYDIDVAYAYKGRGLFRNIASTVYDLAKLDFQRIKQRVAVIVFNAKDPWDIYPKLLKQLKDGDSHAIFFFLLGTYSKENKNISPFHPLFRKLINQISDHFSVGIHPSYNSFKQTNTILKEKNVLQEIIQKPVTFSRQHYLQMNLPITYQCLIETGIQADYSMGYAEVPGFRAGTCTPFYFFDLSKNKATQLFIYPLTLMEGAYLKYLNFTTDKALESIYKLVDEVKAVNGTFISLWHNHTLTGCSPYKGWELVHDKMIDALSENKIQA